MFAAMTGRRQFLAGLGALAAARVAAETAPEPALLRPPALQEGDTVGLITPATYVSDPDRLALAVRTVRYFGLRRRSAATSRKRSGYLGGTVEERLDDLHDMFRDPEVKGVFAIRGGYGSEQLLDRIDYDLIRANPKIFLGYSDITALHLAIQKRAGLVTFHGPVVLSRFTDTRRNGSARRCSKPSRIGVGHEPAGDEPAAPLAHLRTVRPARRAAAGRRQPYPDLGHHGHALRDRHARPHPVHRGRGRGALLGSTAC